VFENEIMRSHKIMCPPNVSGTVVKVYGNGADGGEMFNVNDTVMEVLNDVTGQTHHLSMSHFWPVRMPRPCAEKLPGNVALTTGLRVVDALFPSVLGGEAIACMCVWGGLLHGSDDGDIGSSNGPHAIYREPTPFFAKARALFLARSAAGKQ
jgi:vacuolar-type H+-ATPase catalytic subunit A/Vma1